MEDRIGQKSTLPAGGVNGHRDDLLHRLSSAMFTSGPHLGQGRLTR